MATNPKTISLLVKVVDEREGVLDSASTPVTPGMLLEKVTAFGERPKLKPHATAGGTAGPVMVAIEFPIRMGAGIDTPYSVAGEAVSYIIPSSGDHLYMLLEDEANVAAGARLESNGAGALQAETTTGGLFRALEAVNNTGGSGDVRIRVEVL